MSFVRAYFNKMSGGADLPPKFKFMSAVLAGFGAAIAIYSGVLLQDRLEFALMMAPFGASCFLAFSLPDSPLAQPRNIVVGHLLSAFSGLLVLHVLGDGSLNLAFAVGLAVVAMLVTRTSHAPAGANPLVVFALQPGWDFLITPVLLGSVFISFVALVFNNLRPGTSYPKYW